MVSSIGTVFLPSFEKSVEMGLHTDSIVLPKPKEGI